MIRKSWDIIMMFVILYVCMTLPFTMAFLPDPPYGLIVANYFADGLFWLDIVMNFVTAYENDEGDIITDYKGIALHYFISGWFFIDFFSTFPFASLENLGKGAQATKILKTVRVIKILKMLRVGKLKRFFQALVIRFDVTNTQIAIFKYSLFIV